MTRNKITNGGILEAFTGLLDALVADSLTRVMGVERGGNEDRRGLLNRKDAADYLDVSGPTIDKLFRDGKIKAVTIPGTMAKRFTKRSLDNLIDRQTKERASRGIHHKKTE